MHSFEFETRSFEETIARGKELGATLKPPVLILLTGALGAGKTTITKGIASGFGAAREEEITSPTFTLVHRYSGGPVPVYHIDLYRIGDARDFDTLGLDDVFSENAVVIVEWPDRMKLRTDWPVIRIQLDHVSEEVRKIAITRDMAAPHSS
jgi:tRNA threonylcarbamoyladenosine biosynthesis protein TsaE